MISNTRFYGLGHALEICHISGTWKTPDSSEDPMSLASRRVRGRYYGRLIAEWFNPSDPVRHAPLCDDGKPLAERYLLRADRRLDAICKPATHPPAGASPDYHEHRRLNARAAQTKIRRYLYKYFGRNLRMWSLTFAENVSDVVRADAYYRAFVRRLRRLYPQTQYIAVREFQERGAMHYHFAVSHYIPIETMRRLWAYGFVWVSYFGPKKRRKNKPAGHSSTASAKKAAKYLAKYITKTIDATAAIDTRKTPEELSQEERQLLQLVGRHLYMRSHNMYIAFSDAYLSRSELAALIHERLLAGARLVESWQYQIECAAGPPLSVAGWILEEEEDVAN